MTFSRDRYTAIFRCMRFSSKKARGQESDPRKAILPVWKLVVAIFKRVYTVSEFAVVDEILWPFYGHFSERQHIPSKKARTGIKIWVCADAKSYYCNNAEIYCKSEDSMLDVTKIFGHFYYHFLGSGKN